MTKEELLEKIEEYKPVGKIKALAFCKNITHARMMAEELGKKGLIQVDTMRWKAQGTTLLIFFREDL